MYDTITFSVHRNPKIDPDAPDTYHVRHDTIDTISREGIVEHLEKHHKLSKSVVEPVLSELAITIVEHLLNNYNVHIEGLGTFYLRLGFRRHEGNPEDYKPRFTDPSAITGDGVLQRKILDDYIAHLCTDQNLLDAFNRQLELTVPYKAHTAQYYSASNGFNDIHAYSGITTSAPSHNTRSVGLEKTKWYQATH